MRINEVSYPDGTPIDGYGPGFFRIAGDVIQGAVLVLPDRIAPWGGYGDMDALLAAALQIDVLFVGTGADLAPVPPAFRAALEQAGPGVENMNSPTACRTYNVLLSEGRRIGLALLPV
ncbi:MAG: Mth938-like domain-containing protein [Pseudomonadota bacterium]